MSPMAKFKKFLLSPFKKLTGCTNNIDTDSVSNGDSESKAFALVCVGKENKEYRMPVQYMYSPLFQTLVLKKGKEDAFDFDLDKRAKEGPIILSCTIQEFEHFLVVV
ncbi:hypothetical protein IFM89_021160 [Coptis chinensis]|uniref:Uncharacterized protein n=1 Tax=Coptis chinensis TaxID=261450 RepID=A0A835LM81_9MAGN|nr:hypothetical protein IFM89_021160 [Coptis chinensis]